jgi:hypothetical protein
MSHRRIISEDGFPTAGPQRDSGMFRVQYNVRTPHGSSSTFTLSSRINQMQNSPRSETAILQYLKKRHPGTEIQINDLEFY